MEATAKKDTVLSQKKIKVKIWTFVHIWFGFVLRLWHELHDYRDEIEFGQELLNQVVKDYDSLKEHLVGRTPNWESDRIAKIDHVILITSIAELIYFPSIPTKVSIKTFETFLSKL